MLRIVRYLSKAEIGQMLIALVTIVGQVYFDLKLPDYMAPIGIGVPPALLLRRPDIRQAERQVNAQAATLGASQSDWLPQVFLKGSIGYSSHDLKDLT